MKNGFVIAALLLSSATLADVKVTTGPFVAPDGSKHPNADACVAYVTPTLGADPALCVRTITVAGVCAAADEPELPAEIEAIATQCPNDDRRWFNRTQGWKRGAFPACEWQLVLKPEEPLPAFCTEPQASMYDPSPDDAPTPAIDPEFDERSPEGPQPGPPGAKPVDKPS